MYLSEHLSVHQSIYSSEHLSVHLFTHPLIHLHDITEVHHEERRAADALHWMDLVEDQAAPSPGEAPHPLIGWTLQRRTEM